MNILLETHQYNTKHFIKLLENVYQICYAEVLEYCLNHLRTAFKMS